LQPELQLEVPTARAEMQAQVRVQGSGLQGDSRFRVQGLGFRV